MYSAIKNTSIILDKETDEILHLHFDHKNLNSQVGKNETEIIKCYEIVGDGSK